MKIMYINNVALPSTEAPSVHVMKMCQALSNNGHDVVLIGPQRIKNGVKSIYEYYNVNPSFKIIYVPKPNLKLFGQFLNISSTLLIVKGMKPDLIYTRNDVGAYFSTMMGIRTVYECHNPVIFSGLGKIREVFFKRLIKKKELILIVVISESNKAYIMDTYDVDPDKILLASDCADPIDVTISPINFDNEKKLQVGYIGSLYKGRGKVVIKHLAKNCNFAQFHIVGGTSENITIWKNDLKYPNVTFHGFIPQSKLQKYMLGFDVLLAPYQRNVRTAGGKHNAVKWMSPLKVFEYMASGKPIIASDLPAIREILEHNIDALLCDPDSGTEWEKALVRLHEKHSLRTKLGCNARNKFMDDYTWDKRAEKIMNIVSKKMQ